LARKARHVRVCQRFAENHIGVEVVDELTDADFDRLGVSIGHRRKLLKALAAGVLTAAELPLTKSAIESGERRQAIFGSTSSSARMDPEDLRDASPVSTIATIATSRPPKVGSPMVSRARAGGIVSSSW
jgi:SAM domain (Sterile alpha motif)